MDAKAQVLIQKQETIYSEPSMREQCWNQGLMLCIHVCIHVTHAYMTLSPAEWNGYVNC